MIAATNKNLAASIVRTAVEHLNKLAETDQFSADPKYREDAL